MANVGVASGSGVGVKAGGHSGGKFHYETQLAYHNIYIFQLELTLG